MVLYLRSWSIVVSTLVLEIADEVCNFWASSEGKLLHFIFILALSTYFVEVVIISSEDTMAVVVVVAARSKNTDKNPQIYHILFTTYTNTIPHACIIFWLTFCDRPTWLSDVCSTAWYIYIIWALRYKQNYQNITYSVDLQHAIICQMLLNLRKNRLASQLFQVFPSNKHWCVHHPLRYQTLQISSL